MTQFSDERGAELRELFFESAQELLQSLNDEALTIEKKPGDVETIRSIRRIVHTLKGDSAACGYRELSNLAHELEDALDPERVSSNAALAEIAFLAADTFSEMVVAYHRESSLPSAEPLRRMVGQIAANPETGQRSAKKAPETAAAHLEWTEYERLAAQNAISKRKHVYHVTAEIDPHCAMPIAARQLLLNALGALGEVLATRPEVGSPRAGKRLELLLATDRSVEDVTARCRIPTVISQVSVGPMADLPSASGKNPSGKKAAEQNRGLVQASEAAGNAALEGESTVKPHSTIPAENIVRVDAERIDSVLNLVGELIIGKSMLQQAFLELVKHSPKEFMRGRVSDALAFQARVLNDLQRSVMKIRMVPVEQLFRRFPRMVRDVAKQCGKDIQLTISGQDTDLDKSLLDSIAEPLTHLVRNAASHGIESGEERVRANKPAQGTICLSAYHQGNQVVVEVRDDGRGIDPHKVKAKALEKGLISAEELERLSEADILDLVFRPGFSTAEQVTEISGRGVGLDVVQSVLHRLKGTVEIETRLGLGTTFRLKLPLTLAIIKALLFRLEHRLYALPLNAVAEIARANESDLHQVGNYEVLQLRNQVLPLVRLGHGPPQRSEKQPGKIFVLVIAAGERKMGLIVDALVGEEELVIKALDDQTVPTDLVSGASILGDGRVVLIVNLAAIVDRHAKARPGEAGAVTSGMLLPHTDRPPMTGSSAGGQP